MLSIGREFRYLPVDFEVRRNPKQVDDLTVSVHLSANTCMYPKC